MNRVDDDGLKISERKYRPSCFVFIDVIACNIIIGPTLEKFRVMSVRCLGSKECLSKVKMRKLLIPWSETNWFMTGLVEFTVYTFGGEILHSDRIDDKRATIHK